MRLGRASLAIALILAAAGSAAAQSGVTRYLAGTGFFVSRQGQLVTNAHVVENCVDITLRGGFGTAMAQLVEARPADDLALLRSTYRPVHIARLRADPLRIQPGDQVQLIGYPKEFGVSGQAHVTSSTVASLYGPLKEPHFLSFEDSAQQGNSGGPLLDRAGDVIGVVTAKATLTYGDPMAHHGKAEEKSDVAITLPVLKDLLDDRQVQYQEDETQIYQTDQRIRSLASAFTVQVLCRQK